jgi:hypothetical protein
VELYADGLQGAVFDEAEQISFDLVAVLYL